MIAILLIVLFALFVFFALRAEQSLISKKIALILLFVMFCLVYLFKNNTYVPDVEYYLDYFKYIKSHNISSFYNFEKGYYYFNYFVNSLWENKFSLLFAYAVVLSSGWIFLLQRYATGNLLLSAVLLMLSSFFSLFIMRQYIAIVICIFSLPYVFKRKLIPFLVLTFLAFTFHRTAVIWVFVYLFWAIRLNLRNVLLILSSALLLMFISPHLIEFLLPYVRNLDVYSMTDKTYMSWKPFVISLSMLAIVVMSYGAKFKDIDNVSKVFFFMMLASCTLNLMNLVGTYFVAFYRVNYYFSFSGSILVPNALSKMRSKFMRYVIIAMLVIVYAFLFVSNVDSQGGRFGFII